MKHVSVALRTSDDYCMGNQTLFVLFLQFWLSFTLINKVSEFQSHFSDFSKWNIFIGLREKQTSKRTLEMFTLLTHLKRLLWNYTKVVIHLWYILKGWKWCWRVSGCNRGCCWCLCYVRLGFQKHQLDSKSTCDYCKLYSVVTGNYFQASVVGYKICATELKHLNLLPPMTREVILFCNILKFDYEDHLTVLFVLLGGSNFRVAVYAKVSQWGEMRSARDKRIKTKTDTN